MMFQRMRIGLMAGLLGMAVQAHGAGVGFYATQLTGDADFSDSDNVTEFSADTTQSAFGFAYDTNLSKLKLFNYRLGVEVGTITYKDDAGGELKLDEIAITNDFGFSLMSKENLRIWAGPELRISFQDGEDDGGNEWSGSGAGLGPVLGVNWHMDNGPTLIAKGGFMWSGYVLERGIDNTEFFVGQNSMFVTLGLMFRFNERYLR